MAQLAAPVTQRAVRYADAYGRNATISVAAA